MKNYTTHSASDTFIVRIIIFLFREKGKSDLNQHSFNGDYTGKYLDRVSFPIGGIGAGMFCMDGTGSLSHLSINNRPEIFNEPFSFAAICVKGWKDGAKVLEAQVPEWKMFGISGQRKRRSRQELWSAPIQKRPVPATLPLCIPVS